MELYGICASALVLLVILALSIKEYPLQPKILPSTRQQWTSHTNKPRERAVYLDGLSKTLGLSLSRQYELHMKSM
jgi:hypothetical protein